MFESIPTYDRYRALRLRDDRMHGEDVFAWQTTLRRFVPPVAFDGVFGQLTHDATVKVQTELGLAADGIVGPKTWEAAVDKVAREARNQHNVAVGLLYGQLKLESGFRGGIYSAARGDGTYDAGVAQLNTRYTSPTLGFTVPYSIERLAQTVRAAYDRYAGVSSRRRRWELAAGSWNAPAFANYIAREEGATDPGHGARPSAGARETFEEYMARATQYLRV